MEEGFIKLGINQGKKYRLLLNATKNGDKWHWQATNEGQAGTI
jgi:hypothetical protein